MADPYRTYQRGDKAPRDSGSFSGFALAARYVRDVKRSMSSGESSPAKLPDLYRVKNDSGQDLDRSSVLGLNAPMFLPSDALDTFVGEVAFRCITPNGHEGRFAILYDPVLDGDIARAYIAGTCPVKINVTDTDHTCAEVVDGVTDYLESSESGSAQIIYVEPGLGVKWAYVRFASTCGTSSGGTTRLTRCDCPESSYEIDANCGDCGGFYDGTTKMPRFWWLTINSASDTAYAYYDSCDAIECGQLVGYRIRLENMPGAYDASTCTWIGRAGSCVTAELVVDGDDWKITVLDKDDCVLAVLRKSLGDFSCCGSNTGWELDDNSSCNLSVSLNPDQCTCCPSDTCPPDNLPVCTGTDCCLESCNCNISVTVNDLATIPGTACTFVDDDCTCDDGQPCVFGGPNPDECFNCLKNRPTPQASCGGMNGVYAMTWDQNCRWRFRGIPAGLGSIEVAAELTLSGRQWRLTLKGADGQTAVFESVDWDCDQFVPLVFQGGSCPDVGTPTADFNLCLNVS